MTQAKAFRSRRGASPGRDDGAVAVEFAMVAVMLILSLYAAVEIARLAWTQSALVFAAQEGARCASVNTTSCATPAQITAYAAGRASEAGIVAGDLTATTAACGHLVTGSHVFAFVTSGLAPASITLKASACLP